MERQPIETAPDVGEFLAPNKHGDWLRVRRFESMKELSGENAVIHERSGRWWRPIDWMPLPDPPSHSP